MKTTSQSFCDAFSVPKVGLQPSKSLHNRRAFHKGTKLSASFKKEDDSKKEEVESDKSPFPCLPSIGNSSFDESAAIATAKPSNTGDKAESGVQESAPFVGHKFELQYTCKICETRNSNRVSRIAYRSGVVIVVCKGCQTKHLIADNLGWSIGFEPETSTIEDYLEANGRTDDINRVSSDVFELERVLDMTDNSGSIMGEDGDRHLE